MPRDDAQQRLAAELADELRGVIEALAVNELDAEALAGALRLAAELRKRLAGPPRPRWYHGEGEAFSPEARSAYLDQSPLRGRQNPLAPPLVLERAERPDGSPAVRGRARLGAAYEGPPHGVHGGFVAALFDEMLGSVQGFAAAPSMTGTLEVRYRHVTPLDEELRFEAWVDARRQRSLVARATCHAGKTLTAEARGLFVAVDFDEVRARMRARRGPSQD
jgi:acyl-coenzyme A thioesterase PaaI-like protein